MTAFECLAFEALAFETNCDAQAEEEAADLAFGTGGGGGLFWKPAKKYGPLTIIKAPRLYSTKVQLPPTRVGPDDPGKLLKTELPPSPDERKQEQWRIWQAQVVGRGTSSFLEFLVWEWLVNVKKLKPGLDFYYQYGILGGRTQFGGFVADFYFPFRRLAWNPAGLHFHYTDSKDRGRDRLAKSVLASKGIDLIYLWEDDLTYRFNYTIEQAWLGRQIGRGAL